MFNIKIDKKIFNEVYYPYLKDYSHRYEVYYGGSGSGKSVFVCQKLLIKALISKRKILIIRKVAATLKDSVFSLFIETIKQFQLYDYCIINKSSFSIELPNGSLLLFKGLDDSEKIKSITNITDIWCEEATELTDQDMLQLDLRLRAKTKNLQMFYSFNPISKVNICYKKWFSDTAIVNEDTFILKTTYKDNKFLPESYIKSIEQLKYTNPTQYKVYALGEFCSLDRLVYTNWEEGCQPDFEDGIHIFGLDYGYKNDPSALIHSILYEKEKVIYISDEYVKTGMLNDEIARVIIELGYKKEIIIADSAEEKSIAEIKNLGVSRIRPTTKGKGSVNQGIQKLQQYKFIVNPTCEHIITELQNYSYIKDKSTGEYTNEPIDKFNHCLDALRYGSIAGGTSQLTITLPFVFVTGMSWWTGAGRIVIPMTNFEILNSNVCKIQFAQANTSTTATSLQGAIRVIGKWK